MSKLVLLKTKELQDITLKAISNMPKSYEAAFRQKKMEIRQWIGTYLAMLLRKAAKQGKNELCLQLGIKQDVSFLLDLPETPKIQLFNITADSNVVIAGKIEEYSLDPEAVVDIFDKNLYLKSYLLYSPKGISIIIEWE